MKSRWKKYLAAGLLTAGVLSLTGCHGAKNNLYDMGEVEAD